MEVGARWLVVGFGTVHVLGLVMHRPVPWSATLTAAALLLVAAAAMQRAATGPVRCVAVLVGLTAAAGLVGRVEARGGGIGWPFFLTEAPDGAGAWVEAALITAAVVGPALAALLPEHGTEDRLRAILEPPTPVPAGDPPRRGPVGWRARLATAGTVTVTALAVAVASLPLWRLDFYGQVPILDSRDRTGLLLATVPVLLTVAAAAVLACLSLRRPRSPRRSRGPRWGTAVAAAALVALAVPVAWERGGDVRFTGRPPVAGLQYSRFLEPGMRFGDAPEMRLRPGITELSGPVEPENPGGWVDGSPWSHTFDWDESRDGLVGGIGLLALVALSVALLPAAPVTGRRL